MPARVGILGNPSDGYGGRTLGLAVDQFAATVTLEPLDAGDGSIEIVPGPGDAPQWSSPDDLIDRFDRFGPGSSTDLVLAAVRTFMDVVDSIGHRRPSGFRLSTSTTIPRQVGLAGSSALVIATLRCLAEAVDLEIPDHVLPSIALRVETEGLGIAAGLQDRVVQTYGGLVAMDFGTPTVDARFAVSHGDYERLDPATLPPLFLAYRPMAAASSGTYHVEIRSRFDRGDAIVHDVMRQLATLVTEGRAALRWGATERFAALIARNMELRRALASIPDEQLALIDVADELGLPATFTGSGGAIVGSYDPSAVDGGAGLEQIASAFADIDAEVVALTPTG